jgi:hypothetical protein
MPWIAVEPSSNPAALLGHLPFSQGTATFSIPESVVPDGATGILVFTCAQLSGANPADAWWHVGVNVGTGAPNWFALQISGDPSGSSITVNSQAFWLPMPADRTVWATLFKNDLPSPSNVGAVEIHGYYPGA